MECKQGELSILFTQDPHIRTLNAQYRNIDRATDVLSFPMHDHDMLGDIIISVDTAKRNAKRYEHAFDHEVKFLLVHGVLHIFGYDHKRAQERKQMRNKEQLIMHALQEF